MECSSWNQVLQWLLGTGKDFSMQKILLVLCLLVCFFFSLSEEIVVSQVILRGSNQQKQHVVVQV